MAADVAFYIILLVEDDYWLLTYFLIIFCLLGGFFQLLQCYKALQACKRQSNAWASAAAGKGGGRDSHWIFIHGTHIVDRG